ncbi:MAG: hypothetical protein ABIF77_03815 [bacterium]
MSSAQKKTSKRPTFHEIVLEGSPKTVNGFLAGLLLGSGLDGQVFYCHAEDVNHESVPSRLAELIRLHPRDCHVIVDSDTKKLLERLGDRIEATTGLRLVSSRHIRSASMGFHFEAYAPRYAQDILGRLHALPSGLRLQEFEKEEKMDPKAVGIEAYAPAHDYEMKGAGSIVGRIDLLIETRRELLQQPLLKLDGIKLNLA